MSLSNQQHGNRGNKPGRRKPGLIRLRPACLTAFVALNGFAVAVAVFLAFFNNDSWCFRLPECPGPRATPLLLQIQALDDGENSTLDAIVDPEKNHWADELINALQQIQQAMDNEGDSVSNVVVDPKENPWIDKLINALRDAGKHQSGVPGDGANSTRGVVIDRGENPWIDEMLTVLRNAAEGQVKNTTVREYIEKQMPCAGDANSSTECPAPGAVAPGLREYIRKQMQCAAAGELKVSGFIRFSNNNAEINDAAEKMKINDFVERIDKQASRWGVFGFASEAGGKKRNRKLSWQRACGVKDYICKDYDCQSCDIDCNTYPKGQGGKVKVEQACTVSRGDPKSELLIHSLGEDHFINGVADSRSVVIAACKT